MKNHHGGPAFPRPVSINTKYGTLPDGDRIVEEQGGMSLRDWFAGQALAGRCASEPFGEQERDAKVAMDCYALADAMLEARTK